MQHPTETASPAEWQERLDKHLEIAQQIRAQSDEFQPVGVFVKPDGQEELALLVFPPEAKERAIAGVTRQARDSGCRALIMVMDAWTAPPVPGREPRPGDAQNHPQREECLVLMLFTPNGAWGRTIRYQRKGKDILFQPPDPGSPLPAPGARGSRCSKVNVTDR